MELQILVFDAASDGKLHRLKVILDHKSKAEISALVSSRTNGTTPLLMACKNGHFEVARYLIEKCCADVEQVGSATFDGETIERAPPLWCAAGAGHLNIVKLLVSNKASVNSTTKTNSSPLRAACFDGHFEIAKYLVQHGADFEIANQYGHTCLMIACYKGHFGIAKFLIECGADVNRKSLKGNTALHDSAEAGSLEILKLLLEHGAKFDYDSCGTSPLLSAALNGHIAIVKYFLDEFDCPKLEKANAIELLGATVLDNKGDMIMALECWKQAMQLRLEDPGNPLLEKPNNQSYLASYVDMPEVCTISQLDDLISDIDKMRMQALLVRERILGPGHPDTIHYIRWRGATYADNGNFKRCIQLWICALDILQKVEEPLNTKTENSLSSFVELFSYMMLEAWAVARGFPVVSFLDILHVFERALKEIETAMELTKKQGQDLNDANQFHRTLVIAMLLVGLMCMLKPHLNKSEVLELKKTVYQLVRMNPRGKNGWTPLHLACFKNSSSICRYQIVSFPSLEIVDLLLEVGACPNAVNVDNNTPLHLSAMNKPFAEAVFKLLLKHGAHLDIYNNKKQTPLQLAKGACSFDIYPLQYISLQCLCAQSIRIHNISYKGFVHKRLEEFLDGHCKNT